MADRLANLLKHFELKARVFQAGPLCSTASYDDASGVGYIHVLQHGQLRVESTVHRPLLLDEPTLFLYMNPASHRLKPRSADVSMVCASVEFGAGLHNPVATALPGVVVIPLHELPELDMALNVLFREAGEEHCGRQAILDRLIEVVIIQVLRNLMDRKRLRIGLLAGLADSRLEKALNAIHADPAHNWSLEELASAAGISRARFATTFREVVGMTPGTYLAEWRLSVARTLLRKGRAVQLVADRVGYGSASALSRAFRARTGLSPSEWLNKQEKGPDTISDLR